MSDIIGYVSEHEKKKGGSFYTAHVQSGNFKMILGRYKKRQKAEIAVNKFMRKKGLK